MRNPFKAPTKTDDSSEWKRLHETERKEGDGKSQEQENRVGEKKKDGERHGNRGEGDGGGTEESGGVVEKERRSSAESWRGRALPAGMKIKKRVSGEEEEKKRNGSTRTTEEEDEEEAGCQERSETDPSESKSSPEGKKSGRSLSPSPKSDHEQTTEEQPPGAVSPLQSGTRKDGDKKRHSGKSRASDSDGQTRTRVASAPTAEAPRRHDSASGGRSSSSSGVEKPQKTQKTQKPSSVRPDSPPSFAALADQCKPRSGAAPTNQHPQASPRDQPQRRSPIQLSDDDDDGRRQAEGGDDDDDDDDDVQVVSVQPGPKRSLTVSDWFL